MTGPSGAGGNADADRPALDVPRRGRFLSSASSAWRERRRGARAGSAHGSPRDPRSRSRLQRSSEATAASCSARNAISSGVPGGDPERGRRAERAHRPHDHPAPQQRVVERSRVVADVDEEKLPTRRPERARSRARGARPRAPLIASRLTARRRASSVSVVEARERGLLRGRRRRRRRAAPCGSPAITRRARRRTRPGARRARRSSRTSAARGRGRPRFAYSSIASGNDGSSTYSKYASSTTVRTCSGTRRDEHVELVATVIRSPSGCSPSAGRRASSGR